MASVITATNSSGLTTSADNSGVLQLASGTGNLVTIPSVTGTAMVSGNMPAFSAYQSTFQTISSATFTKIQFQTEEFDTANCYDNATNYRFTPNVAGYYQVTTAVQPGNSAAASNQNYLSIYKNGSRAAGKETTTQSISGTNAVLAVATALIYMNGTTDYLEVYAYMNNGGSNWNTNSFNAGDVNRTYFQAVMVRGA